MEPTSVIQPPDFLKDLKPEELDTIKAAHPDLMRRKDLQFLAGQGALAVQNDIEPVEGQSPWTALRRKAGFLTASERKLKERQDKLYVEEYLPHLKMGQAVEQALAIEKAKQQLSLANAPQTIGEAESTAPGLYSQVTGAPIPQQDVTREVHGPFFDFGGGAPPGLAAGTARRANYLRGYQQASPGTPDGLSGERPPISPPDERLLQQLSSVEGNVTPEAVRRLLPQTEPGQVSQELNPSVTTRELDFARKLPPAGQMAFMEGLKKRAGDVAKDYTPQDIEGAKQTGAYFKGQPIIVGGEPTIGPDGTVTMGATRTVQPPLPTRAVPGDLVKLALKEALTPHDAKAKERAIQELQDLTRAYTTPEGVVNLPPNVKPHYQNLQRIAGVLEKEKNPDETVSRPISDYLKAKNLPLTPANIDIARNALIEEDRAMVKAKADANLGSEPTREMLRAIHGENDLATASPAHVMDAIQAVQKQRVETARAQGAAAVQEHPVNEGTAEKVTALLQNLRVVHALKTEFTPQERAEYAGLIDLPLNRLMSVRRADPKFNRFYTLLKEQGVAAFEIGGKQFTGMEKKIVFGYLPTGEEWTPGELEAKLKAADDHSRFALDSTVSMATTPRKNVRAEVGSLESKGKEITSGNRTAKKAPAVRFNELIDQGVSEKDAYSRMKSEGYQ